MGLVEVTSLETMVARVFFCADVFENSGLKLLGQMRDTENVDSIRECREDRSGNIRIVILASATRMRCSLLGTMSLKNCRIMIE